jgi:Mg2+ and Co2+ transporter CorA
MKTSFKKMVEKDLKTKMFFEMIERVENETDENELEILSNHKIDGIRLLVASNENTNSRTLRFLSFDDKEEVRATARSNKNFVSVKTTAPELKPVSFFSTIKSLFFRKELRLA